MIQRDATTVAMLLREGHRRLRDAAIDSPALDAEILLSESLGSTREQLLANLPEPAPDDVTTAYREMIERRLAGEPVAYIIGRRAFYRHEFSVNEWVLIPRPETEYLVEWSAEWINRHPNSRHTVVDVGTGSGAIGISIALETKGRHLVIGSEISEEALTVADRNRKALDAPVALVRGHLLDWCRGEISLISANLPYLKPEQAHSGIAHEPEVALFAGADGFVLNRELLAQAATMLARPGGLIMEIDPDQQDLACGEAREHFPADEIRIERDLSGAARYLIIERE